jgi:hypothetical protein
LLYLLGYLLPWFLRRRWLALTLGYELDPTSRIGLSLVLPDKLVLRAHSSIRHLNVCRHIDLLVLDSHAVIGSGNWIAGTPSGEPKFYSHLPDRRAELLLAEHAALTNNHYVDCTGGISIGNHATIAGVRSQLLTHGIDIVDSRQDAHRLEVGPYSMVGTGTILLAGARVPHHAVVAAGSVVTGHLDEPYTMYAGAPAKSIKALGPESLYFSRAEGEVR